jgi:hypothetical protein
MTTNDQILAFISNLRKFSRTGGQFFKMLSFAATMPEAEHLGEFLCSQTSRSSLLPNPKRVRRLDFSFLRTVPSTANPLEKQVAMIAQKVMDAKHAQARRSQPLSSPDR